MSVTLKKIAEQADVSITTVSRILNNRAGGMPIREETRQRVQDIAAQLGYKPNMMARALRGSRSSLLGTIVRDISEPFFSQILKGVNDAAVRRHYRIFLGHVAQQANMTVDYSSMFEQAHADGIIIIGDMQDDELAVQTLAKTHRNLVGISDRVTPRGFPGVYADDIIGTRLALDHLWNLGHRQIVCVSDSAIMHGKSRAEAYAQFMREHGEQPQVLWTSRFAEGGYQAGEQLLAAGNRPSAIFATVDTIAIGLIQAFFQAGLTVPRDLSIIGYDDIDMARFTVPPLTTISQNGFEMGFTAANLLIDLISEAHESNQIEDVVLTPQLVVRQSTAQHY